MRSHLVSAPSTGLFRTARFASAALFPDPPEALTLVETIENDFSHGRRWEDLFGRVRTMHCGTTPCAAIADSIARYREREGLRDKIDAFVSGKPDPGEPSIPSGRIPEAYFEDWVKVHIRIDSAVRFVDLGHQDTLDALTYVLRRWLKLYELEAFTRENLVFGRNRVLTRLVAGYYWELSQTYDHGGLVGLRYPDEHNHAWEYWALWQDYELSWMLGGTALPITRDDADLAVAAQRLGIAIPSVA